MPTRQLISKIHVARKQLALDEDTYRDALEGQTGHRSSAQMSDKEIIKCLRHFESLGWQPKAKPKKYDDQRGDAYSATPKQKRLIEALWHNIYRGNDETKHLRQFLWNHFKVSDLRFCDKDKAHQAIEALKKMQKHYPKENYGQSAGSQAQNIRQT